MTTQKKAQFLDLILDFDQSLEEHLRRHHPEVAEYRVVGRSLDARGANRGKVPRYHYRLSYVTAGESFPEAAPRYPDLGRLEEPPIIVGAGPAGLFCALRLLDYGVPSVLIERGSRASERMRKIARFWRYGNLDPDDNVCYGEGGAGLFSDGKLITRIKSPYVNYVMRRLVDFGAPPEIAYVADPHLGSNKIRGLIGALTAHLEARGVRTIFNGRVEELLFDRNRQVSGVEYSDLRHGGEKKRLHSGRVVLAFGHSATEFYHRLHGQALPMEAKDFAVGVRMEHPRRLIDRAQLGDFCASPLLSSARYRLSHHNQDSHLGTYSFCMCPGGHVLSSGTDPDGLVTNGMSNFSRNSPWSNAALVVTVKNDPKAPLMAGLELQRGIERRAYDYSRERATGREIPGQSIQDFLRGRESDRLPRSSCPSGVAAGNLRHILPAFITDHLGEALEVFERQIPGLIGPHGLLLAPETRTSAPLRLVREEQALTMPGFSGLYPCGEGAGHAGGITSAAVDGIRVAMAILNSAKSYQGDEI